MHAIGRKIERDNQEINNSPTGSKDDYQLTHEPKVPYTLYRWKLDNQGRILEDSVYINDAQRDALKARWEMFWPVKDKGYSQTSIGGR